MPLSMHALSVETFIRGLGNLSALLDKGAEYAAAEKIDPTSLIQASLAPDMFTLGRQVQICCDLAKLGVSRMAGRDAPVFEDTETTFDELKARIAKTVDYLRGFDVAALEAAETREVVIPTPQEFEFHMTGAQFLTDWSLPNFYFHLATAYDILRHKGVPIGKRDFLAHAAVYMKSKPAA